MNKINDNYIKNNLKSKKKLPLVSVILPIYNVAEYLDKCLCSISSQIYKNIELIVVYRQSIDDSLNIVNRYLNKFRKVLIIEQQFGKLSNARNLGLEAATGDYITFIDADDYVSPEYVLELITHMKDEVDLVMTYPSIIDSEIDNKLSEYFNQRMRGSYRITEKEVQSIPVVVWGKLFRSSLIRSLNLRFPSNCNFEDNYLHWTYLMNCKNIYIINDNLYFYRIRNDSLTGDIRTAKRSEDINNAVIDLIKVVRSILEFFNKKESPFRLSPHFLISYLFEITSIISPTYANSHLANINELLDFYSRKNRRLIVGKIIKNSTKIHTKQRIQLLCDLYLLNRNEKDVFKKYLDI